MKQSAPGGKKPRLLALILTSIVIIALAVVGFGSNYLFGYAMSRSGAGGDRHVQQQFELADGPTKTIEENRRLYREVNESFMRTTPTQPVSVTTKDGINLHGEWYQQPNSHNWLISVHGYRQQHTGLMTIIRNYHEAGFQVLAPDLRGCGKSGGEYVTMGWHDKDDMLLWIDWILSVDPQARIVLHGVSMGAATVMMTSGLPTPDAVVAFVEDCGYTNVWDVFASELKLRFGLPAFPLMHVSSLICKTRQGFTFAEADALAQLRNSTKPMLFIHGTVDDFIPYSMMETLYAAKPGEKQMLTVPDAGHNESYLLEPDLYWDTVFRFLAPYIAQE